MCTVQMNDALFYHILFCVDEAEFKTTEERQGAMVNSVVIRSIEMIPPVVPTPTLSSDSP